MKLKILFFLIFIFFSASMSVSCKPVVLRFATFLPPAHPYGKFLMKISKDMSRLSNNQVKIKYYGSSSLGKASELYEVTKDGLADMSLWCCGYSPSEFPVSLGVQLPFFGSSAESSAKIVLELFKKGVFNKDFSEVKYLFPLITAPLYLFSKKKIEKFSDFKGIRIVGGSKIFKDICRRLGAVPVIMSYSDVYFLIQRGVIDGAVTNWPAAIAGWKWYEIIKYAVDLPIMSGWHCGIIMNKKSWSKIPDNVKAKWEKKFTGYTISFAKFCDKIDSYMRVVARKNNMKIIKFSQKEKDKMAKFIIPVWKDWIKSNGEDAVKFYRIYTQTLKKEGKPVIIKIPEFLK